MRTIHEAFWRDKRLAKMPDATRLTFIGVWMLADDAGWLVWDLGEMAAQLFPWMNVRPREEKLKRATDRLVTEGRIVLHECGHAEVPKLHIYQRPGRPYYAVRDQHRKACNRLRSDYKPLEPLVPGEVKGSEVIVKGRAAERVTAPARGLTPIRDIAQGLEAAKRKD